MRANEPQFVLHLKERTWTEFLYLSKLTKDQKRREWRDVDKDVKHMKLTHPNESTHGEIRSRQVD